MSSQDRTDIPAPPSQTVGEETNGARRCTRCHEAPVPGNRRVCDACRTVTIARGLQSEQKPGPMCGRCGEHPVMGRNRACDVCKIAAIDGHQKKWREAAKGRYNSTHGSRKEQGLCIQCGSAPARDGKVECESCAANRMSRYWHSGEKTRMQVRRQEAIARGLCAACKREPTRPGRTECERCAESARQRYRNSKARERVDGKRRTRLRAGQAAPESEGICTRCRKAPASREKKYCCRCSEYFRAFRRLQRARRVESDPQDCNQEHGEDESKQEEPKNNKQEIPDAVSEEIDCMAIDDRMAIGHIFG
ncbi:hypothetical protein PG984_009758 [Apiospora sp. TS-2023a]